jgi:hypothetical protein
MRALGGTGRWAAAAALAAVLAGSVPVVGAVPAGAASEASTVWLCRPGMADDPCTAPLTTTVVAADGHTSVQKASDNAKPPIDCFYVYPTVSKQTTINANLAIDPQETAVARAQASRFSQDCRVYAPMYPQLTSYAIEHPTMVSAADLLKAYDAVLAAWQDYLARYNKGRGVVVIGHSQGAAMLINLVKHEIDPNPSVRKLLVSAIILGGNVIVPIGKTVGGSFQNVPACQSATQTGCVVAYSSFDQTPPTDTLFGKAGTGVSELTGTSTTTGVQVLCVNPAALSGGSGTLEPYFPTAKVVAALSSDFSQVPSYATPWAAYPDLYSAECEYQNGISWLQVNDVAKAGDTRAVVTETLGPTWGLHLVDVNIALGNLVSLVRSEALAYGH